MAQATFSVRIDEDLKRQFDALCADFGMASDMQAFLALGAEAKKNGVQDLTLDEINEEIRHTRYGDESNTPLQATGSKLAAVLKQRGI